MKLNSLRNRLLVALLVGLTWQAAGQERAQQANVRSVEQTTSEWLMRMHEASRRRAYMGTMVVSAGENMSTARIWHVCDGKNQIERVESLTGPQRSTFRRDDEVITFLPASGTAVRERRESLALFPGLLKSTQSDIDKYYVAQRVGTDRVAGYETDMVQFLPTDSLRFGYRVWSEQKTGLILKLQIVDVSGQVLEQVAFSELKLDAPVSMRKLSKMMADTKGYRVVSPDMSKTNPQAEGWRMKGDVPGFKSISCYRRRGVGRSPGTDDTLQWIFSDGLATVSVFLKASDQGLDSHEGSQNQGATHTLTRRLGSDDGYWWVSLVGEVPVTTLLMFAGQLERVH